MYRNRKKYIIIIIIIIQDAWKYAGNCWIPSVDSPS